MKNLKKLLFSLLLLTPIVLFVSCGGDDDNTVHSTHGTWEYNKWIVNGEDYDDVYDTYLFLCENTGFWATEVYSNGCIISKSILFILSLSSFLISS